MYFRPFLENIRGGEYVTLVIKAKTDHRFRGFLVQAIDENDIPIGEAIDENDIPIGEFTFNSRQRAKCLKCGDNVCGSITHKNPGLKSQVIATWSSPLEYVGTVRFRYTVVKSYTEYWVAINGPEVVVTN